MKKRQCKLYGTDGYFPNDGALISFLKHSHVLTGNGKVGIFWILAKW
jgi:hypothetical protein